VTEHFKRIAAIASTTAFRITAGTVALFLVIAGLLIGFLFWQTNQVLTEQVVATLSAEAEALRSQARLANPSALVDAVAARSRPEGPGLYHLSDGAGRKLAGNLSRSPPEIEAERSGGVFRYRPSLTASGPERLGVAIALAMPRGERLIIGRDIEDQRAFADGVKRLFVASFFILTLAGLACALVLSRLVLKRIEAMNVASRQIMAGDFSRRVPLEGSGDELDGLADNLNAMLDRIEQLMAGLREVSENIAHDLKTPLNRLRNRVEAALREPAGEGAHREALSRTIEEADDLIKTFNALLLIARLKASPLDKTAETLDCGAVVRDVAELYAPVAEEQGLRLEIAVAEGQFILANRQLIGQAVANLIDNALKYAPAGVQPAGRAAIRVEVLASGGSVEVTVGDHGPGIASADRDRALRRFVRLDESRTKPGTGLGLSLVAAVARLHGGRIRLEDNNPGLKVRLILAAQPPPPVASAGGAVPREAGGALAMGAAQP
jgi:signal transduction histidine kinase